MKYIDEFGDAVLFGVIAFLYFRLDELEPLSGFEDFLKFVALGMFVLGFLLCLAGVIYDLIRKP